MSRKAAVMVGAACAVAGLVVAIPMLESSNGPGVAWARQDSAGQVGARERIAGQTQTTQGAQSPATQPVGSRQPRRDEPAGEAAPPGDGPAGTRLTGESLYNVQPAVTPAGDGTNLLAWVGYLPGAGDFLFAAVERDGKLEDVIRVTQRPGDIFRPVWARGAVGSLAAGTSGEDGRHVRKAIGALPEPQSENGRHEGRPLQGVRNAPVESGDRPGETTLLLWTQTVPGQGPRIFHSFKQDRGWSEPAEIPGQAPHTLNPEATALPDGRIAVVYQVFRDTGYGIGLRVLENGRWSAEMDISSPGSGPDDPLDCWDPVVALDPSSGRLLIVWVSYFPRDYDLCWRTYERGRLGPVSRIRRKNYDLHPHALADPKGGVWLAWDNIAVPNHASSGPTFIKHPHQRDTDLRSNAMKCYVAVAKWEDGKLTVPGGARVTPEGENVRHGGTPKLGWDDAGRLYVAYRGLHAPISGRTLYYWDVSVRALDGDKWTPRVRLADSDGPTEEAALVSGGDGAVRVFFQRDYRRTKTGNDGNQAPRVADERMQMLIDMCSHHADYGDPKLRHGDLFVTRVPGLGGPPKAEIPLKQPPVERVDAPPAVVYRRGEYRVFFGDLHKHTNVSRCSRGAEPDPDDHYRYSRDVCRYDFFGVSDHSGHTSDYNWWRLQKLADLYYVPGDFTTLFGVEWNGPEGHKNVMSPSRHLPLLATTGAAPDAEALWDELAQSGVPAVTIPHSSSMRGQFTDWRKHDPRFERLVEIFQACRGSFEGEGAPRLFPDAIMKGRHVQDALARGYRLGIIGSTDHGYGATYCCVYATENSREAVFDALYDRRCYAATAYGIVVDFEVNGAFMGRDVKRGSGVTAAGYVRGNGKLDKVQILKSNQVMREWTPDGAELKIEWTDSSPGAGLHWYYLRVIQEDDEMAWSSPVWVED